ncbi:PNGase F N-terminal domain-containing protein [Sphingobacterium hungaricum]|uniref:Peptide-N-glycosidase n=1 Tax=Sphingobacterium hungaricum TaxID=2082723 RepID=A0A928YPC5_9SPHI|nr:PNGase F N-terminal domain-containing protein [Sphingobacterium hungaricum]MBE8712332.1 peptide-N-glycosidase [Sphingobacterium hungaricum]
MKILALIFSLFLSFSALAQQSYKITYLRSSHDQVIENQDPIILFANKSETALTSGKIVDGKAKFPYERTFTTTASAKNFYKVTNFSESKEIATIDSLSLNRYAFELLDEEKEILGYKVKKAKTLVNSNTIEVWYTNALDIKGGPNETGQSLGLVLEYVRNGNSAITASSIEKINEIPALVKMPAHLTFLDELTYRDEVWKSRFIQIPIFKNEKINFSDEAKSDSILRFANGTVILKKVKIPEFAKESQGFIELVEKSNGDAYDRTGSVFMIAEDQAQSFFDGMKNGMATLPFYEDATGKKYQGMVRTDGYSPVFELMRFFTPFGVSHFNKNLTLKGKTWQDSVSYRQDISEFLPVMAGKEVYIGTYIGNYDKGGHKVSLELTIHPGNSNSIIAQNILSIFNTTNVMEMGGQDYATLFGQEKGLEVTFTLPQDAKNAKLRYITTGHGGWGEGDEFVPKVNSIFLDNELAFKFTPWRVDCGSYRLYNPVSGNFGNGLSSSDLSRSNWCPGTITYPNYIDLGDLKAGTHTIRVHIPQGAPEGSSFSFWNVSGALIYD